MGYQIEDNVEEEFRSFDWDGELFTDKKELKIDHFLPAEESFLRLLTIYEIKQNIREQVKCRECLTELGISEEYFYSDVNGRKVAVNQKDNLILISEQLSVSSCGFITISTFSSLRGSRPLAGYLVSFLFSTI